MSTPSVFGRKLREEAILKLRIDRLRAVLQRIADDHNLSGSGRMLVASDALKDDLLTAERNNDAG